jgi:putative phosphotransacetylase
MIENKTVDEIVNKVMLLLKDGGKREFDIPVGVSNKHIHLTQEHVEILFGKGYELTKARELKQPGQYAAKETVCVAGPSGSFPKIRVLGPVRKASQLEISRTDAYALGVNPPVRDSGDLKGSAAACVIGPAGMVVLTENVIIARRHIHMTPEIASSYGVKGGDIVSISCESPRKCVFYDTLIRATEESALEIHLDTDEANAAGIKNGMLARIEGRG